MVYKSADKDAYNVTNPIIETDAQKKVAMRVRWKTLGATIVNVLVFMAAHRGWFPANINDAVMNVSEALQIFFPSLFRMHTTTPSVPAPSIPSINSSPNGDGNGP